MMKQWLVVVVMAVSLGACGANPEDMAGSVRNTQVGGAKKIEGVKGNIQKVGGGLASKDGGGDPGGDKCGTGEVPCGTGPCCKTATEICGDGSCHPRESKVGGEGGGPAEVQGVGGH